MTVDVVKIVVAGDPRLLREALCHVLSAETDFEVVGETEWGPSAVCVVAEAAPDVLLLDITMMTDDPEPLLQELLARCPALDIIVLSNHGEPGLMQRLLDLGVRAYLHKNISQLMLKSTIRDLSGRGQPTVIISLPTSRVASMPQVDWSAAVPAPDAAAGYPLSERELEVLTFAAGALTNRQIASRMDITEGTVKRHLRNVFYKLGATSRIDAINKAVDARLLPPARTRR